MPVAVSLILVAVFLAMNAFFVIAEFALVRVRKSQIDMAVERGEPGAKNAQIIVNNVNDYLSACQLGITLASLALGWLGEPAFSALIRPVLEPLGIPAAAISIVAVAIGYIIMTALHVIVGELIPKSFAIFSTERYALKTATPLRWFYRITYPIMWLFNKTTRGVVKLAGHDPDAETDAYTEEEIQLLIDESTESGLIDAEQNEYVDNIFELDDKDAGAIMTPRTSLVCLDLDEPWEESLTKMREYQFTRYPVIKGDKDNIVGFVHVKDLLAKSEYLSGANTSRKGDDILTQLIRPIEAVPEGMTLQRLLRTLRNHRANIVVVVDEHGGTAGIVTMSDVIEQFVGRIDDEYIHEDFDETVAIADNVYQVDGALPISDFIDLIGFELPEASECDTAGGLLLELFDQIPAVGDSIEINNSTTDGVRGDEGPDGGTIRVKLTVDEMDGYRIASFTAEKSEMETPHPGRTLRA